MKESPYRTADVRRALRVAMLVAGETPAGIESQLLGDLASANYLELAGVYRVTAGARAQPAAGLPRLILSLYRALDRRIAAEPAAAAASGACARAAEPGRTVLTDVSEGDLASANLDVILAPCCPDAAAPHARHARFGVWWVGASARLGRDCGYWDHFAALIKGVTPTTVMLWAATATEPRPMMLDYASVRWVSGVSVARNLAAIAALRRSLWQSGLRGLAVRGWESLRSRGVAREPLLAAHVASLSADSPVSGLRVGAALLRMMRRHLQRRRRMRKVDQKWLIGVRAIKDHGAAFAEPEGYQCLPSPRGRWYADPFVITVAARDYLFVEDFDQRAGRARISVAALDGNRIGEPQVALERPYHLSYPQVFAHAGEIFMIPESGAHNTVELYRASSFPTGWELVRVLYRGPAFDTTVVGHEGRFWFFTSLIEDSGGDSAQLLLFHSDRPDGDWQLHPENPLSCDARYARSAGSFFIQDGQLLRPAQDGSVTYGGAVRFCRVRLMNEEQYREEEVRLLEPPRSANGIALHTYNRSSRTEVVDIGIAADRRTGVVMPAGYLPAIGSR